MMQQRSATISSVGVLLYLLIAVPVWSLAARGGMYQVADGVAIYVKLVPSKALQRQPELPADARMHGGAPAADHVYHLIVDLFDHRTGERITSAEVVAQIIEAGAAGPAKPLEPMQLDERLAFANYFVFPGTGPYQVRLTIRRPNTSRPIQAELAFEHWRP